MEDRDGARDKGEAVPQRVVERKPPQTAHTLCEIEQVGLFFVHRLDLVTTLDGCSGNCTGGISIKGR
jgi:hypothetical protein